VLPVGDLAPLGHQNFLQSWVVLERRDPWLPILRIAQQHHSPLPVDVGPLESKGLAHAPAREVEKLDEVPGVLREVGQEGLDVLLFEEPLPRVIDTRHIHQRDSREPR